ncbi:helix-turn-helix transcriptional regulator [Lactobacillus reuteri]|uniref:helix-turn-helix domain-containing protein n=1 Tax=Limosilactobacillus reuteri TaxID=1598 RepID=UPI00146C8982|nr:helix-turn-helix transcriptional regulator [Limosilactobacillus reuteri]NMV53535.1 helix-turn-helix transcriptional regulator [Limosilactobacillus reuteri]NMV57098.1 helix-turn-helix transcriptional regulator [Limosilactobacillus reuteri]
MRTWKQIRENQTAIPEEELSLIDTLSFLQAQRIKQGISQTEFAKRINMTQPQLAKIENLDSTPTLATLNKYAKGLGLEIKLSILPLETSK